MVQAAGLLALVILVGALAAPLAALVLGRLPGAGLGLSNVLGMLLVSWLVWIVASLGLAPYGRGLIVAALVVLALAGGAAALRLRAARPSSDHAAGAVAASTLAARRERRQCAIASQAVLVVLSAAGMLLASFQPAVWGTEKPMDLAFMSAIDASSSFPPHDPWMSGKSLNYYYLGHLTMAWPQRLLGLDPAAGYLLSWGLLLGLSGAAVFTVAASTWSAVRATSGPGPRRLWEIAGPVPIGLLGVALVVLVGNLSGVREWTRATGLASYDWFASSRVIPGTINEIPSFSFVLGDLHAHVLAIPPTLLALAFALQTALHGPRLPSPGRVAPAVVEGAVAALAVGWLYAVNSWSYPVVAGMLVMAVVVHLRSERRRDTAAVVVWLLAVLAASLVLISPFLAHFDAGAQGIGLARERDRQPFTRWLGEHLLLYALPAWAVGALYATRVAALDRRARIRWLGGGAIVVLVLGSLLAAARLSGALVMTVACLVALHAVSTRALAPTERWLWLLVAGAAALLAGPEVLIVRDAFVGTEFERMNTVFKLGYQAYILIALAAACAIPWALGWLPRRAGVRSVWTVGLATLAGLSLVFPFAGSYARTGGFANRPSLDGLAWLRASAPGDPAAIAWIRAHVPGDDVVLEAFGDDYSPAGHARISSFTGRPTVLGWQGHELQWEHAPGTRAQDVRTLYATTDAGQARALLTRYDVRWVVVGPLERAESGVGEVGQRKWFQLADVVFSRAGTTVWKVRGAGSL